MKKITLKELEGPVDTFCFYMCPQPMYNYILYIQSMLPAITPCIEHAVEQYKKNLPSIASLQRLQQDGQHCMHHYTRPLWHLSECGGNTVLKDHLRLSMYGAFGGGQGLNQSRSFRRPSLSRGLR